MAGPGVDQMTQHDRGGHQNAPHGACAPPIFVWRTSATSKGATVDASFLCEPKANFSKHEAELRAKLQNRVRDVQGWGPEARSTLSQQLVSTLKALGQSLAAPGLSDDPSLGEAGHASYVTLAVCFWKRAVWVISSPMKTNTLIPEENLGPGRDIARVRYLSDLCKLLPFPLGPDAASVLWSGGPSLGSR